LKKESANKELKQEIAFLEKTIHELKIEQEIFNGISIQVYLQQRDIDNLKYLLNRTVEIVNNCIDSKSTKNLNNLLKEIKSYNII
jgi:hypothetical protein